MNHYVKKSKKYVFEALTRKKPGVLISLTGEATFLLIPRFQFKSCIL